MTPRACKLLLFGATGDLAQRMLLPSLYGLHADGLLPEALTIMATAHSEMEDEGYRCFAAAALDAFVAPDRKNAGAVAGFLDRLAYCPLDANDPAGYALLSEKLGDVDAGLAIFLSTAPWLFGPTIKGLKSVGLTTDNVRVGLEKPLGSDLASGREINDIILGAFPEDRTFRVDHFLGKETVQNILALRFGNSLFEPVWNAQGIEHVQITVSETVGLEGRAGYYDKVGALRDMVQNHMLQLLALIAMEPPARFNAAAIRDEKVKVLRSLRKIGADDVATHTVTGQYQGGVVSGRIVAGYSPARCESRDGRLGADRARVYGAAYRPRWHLGPCVAAWKVVIQ